MPKQHTVSIPELEPPAGAPDPEHDITALLVAWSEGDSAAGEELMQRVGGRLRKLAASFLRYEREDHTLQTTALVHEAYLRLVRQEKVSWQGRQHFFSITGRMMRRILVDHARRQRYLKRGGHLERLSEGALEHQQKTEKDEQLLALGEALEALTAESPELASVVELRYFVGLTGEEIAASLGISRPTVQRRWKTARAWLFRYLQESPASERGAQEP